MSNSNGSMMCEAEVVYVDEHAARELRAELNDGLAHSGLTATQAAARSRLGRTTVSQALHSPHEVPTARTVAALARALRLDEQRLLDLRKAAARGEPDTVDVLGRLISEFDPLDLEVHPAGAVRDSATALPAYVNRTHDEKLAEVVSAAAGGRSGMAVLVGTSSTGKTRACWEAVQPLAASGWRLWHPYDPTRVEAALDGLGRVAPRTVVWLNEAQHYLDAGEQMAAALHGLLTDSGRAPVLVLATLWPDYAKVYANRPEPGLPDPYARARELLAGRRIEVASEFDEAGVREATRLAEEGDRLWAAVLTQDHHGRLAQLLAGAPELMRRYGEVSAPAKALLRVAMDARRLGVGPHLPLVFLTDAAQDYLHDDDLHALEDEDWLEQALAELAKPVHGDLAPLRRIHPRRQRHHPQADTHTTMRASVSEPSYRLADYLEQHGRRERRMLCPPLSFWESAHAFLTNPDDLAALGLAALNRHRVSWAEALYRRAIDAGNTNALAPLALIRERIGDRAEANELCRRAADTGDTSALMELALMRGQAGDRDEAEELYRRAADTGDTSALMELALMREEAGDRDEAEELALRAANSGKTSTLILLARARDRAGDLDGAETLYRHAVDAGDTKALALLSLMREWAGGRDEADTLALRALDAGDTKALALLTQMREEAGDRERAEELALRALDAGNAKPLVLLSLMREQAEDKDEAARLALRAEQAGNTDTRVELALMREQAEQHDQVERLALRAAGFHDTHALIQLARIREEAGDPDGAERIALRAEQTGDNNALVRLALLREQAGDRDGAERLALRAADAGNTNALTGFVLGHQWIMWPFGLEPNGTPSTTVPGQMAHRK